MLKFKEGIYISKAINYALWGTDEPSSIQKSIGRRFHKNKKLKKQINKLLRKHNGK